MNSALLLSGGQDSVAIAYWLRPKFCITVDYGQKPAAAEVRASSKICSELGLEHVLVSVDCSALGSGDLSGLAPSIYAPSSEWWPYRNQLLISLALSHTLRLGADEILLGSVATDSGHTDGTKVFIDAIDTLVRIQEGGLRVRAPGIDMTSTELIHRSRIPLDLLYWAHSCHKSDFACGLCRGCLKHKNVIHELGEPPF